MRQKRGKLINLYLFHSGLQNILDMYKDDECILRQELRIHFKNVFSEGQSNARKGLLDKKYIGGVCAELLSGLMDELIQGLAEFFKNYLGDYDEYPVALVAVGGYGRGRLAPYSDIDLLFLLPEEKDLRLNRFIEQCLYILWDIGLKIGYSTRTIRECIEIAKSDLISCTTMMESRFLWGDDVLYENYKKRLFENVLSKDSKKFIEKKLKERDERHREQGESRYLVEPNIKEGKGGLRDLNTLFWIAKYHYQIESLDDLVENGFLTKQELRYFRKCENFLWFVRCHLHFSAGRAAEHLSFDWQMSIVNTMQIRATIGLNPVERFMRRYFLMIKDVGNLTRIFCAKLEEQNAKSHSLFKLPDLFRNEKQIYGFRIFGQRLAMVKSDVFEKDPVNLIRMFQIANQYNLLIHPDTLRAVTYALPLIDSKLRQNEDANRIFLEILTAHGHPERILRRMNESGVLGKFLPDFGRIVALMQFNMYHHYTADEHLLRAIGILAEIDYGSLQENYTLAHEILNKKLNRNVIYLSVLLHDIAKGRPEDHSIAGARIAHKWGKRFGLTEAETDLTAWLVEFHLVMSDTAQKRDLSDRRVIIDFVDTVQTLERLRHLFVLTVVDISAVGVGVWNSWKAQLLQELYIESEAMLVGSASHINRFSRVQAAKDKFLQYHKEVCTEWPQERRDAYIQSHYDAYWLSTDLKEQYYHSVLLEEAEKQSVVIEAVFENDKEVVDIYFVCPDHSGLFSNLAGACAMSSLHIVDARIMTTRNGMALDILRVQDLNLSYKLDEARLDRLRSNVEKVLSGECLPSERIAELYHRKRRNVFKKKSVISVDNDISSHSTVIEVDTLDRAGLLYALTRTLFHLNIKIIAARVTSFGERAVDVFYVQDLTGAKIILQDRLDNITHSLYKTLGTSEDFLEAMC